jgi:cobalamin biosynthesis Co2+ chelatase CbiK
MKKENNKAILVVSFGTSYEDTRKKTIDVIEKEIENTFQEYKVYRAWTSKMILKKISERDGLDIDTVTQAMKRMAADGIAEVLIQPTHILNGIENDIMTQDVLAFKDSFDKIIFGDALLTTTEDNMAVIEAIHKNFASLADDEVLVLMGHGSTHYVNTAYAALDYMFKDMGYKNIFLGTVEAYPGVETIIKKIKEYHPRKVILAPFMIVAGDHATHDMAHEDPDSWRSRFESAGFDVECVMKGIGEYPEIREIILAHVKKVL